MRRLFNYSDDNDHELYFEKNISNLDLKIIVCTVSSSKERLNEDSFSIVLGNNCLWVAVFDGVTSLRSIPLLKGQTGARFASHFLKEALANSLGEETTDPREILIHMNELLLKKAKVFGGTLNDTHSLPASMGTIMKIDFKKHILTFAHVGDTYGIIYKNDNSSQIITDDKNKTFGQEIYELIKQISIKKGITVREAQKSEEVKKTNYEMYIRRNNNPNGLGSGLINGDPNVKKYIQEGNYSLEGLDSILLATDGLVILGEDINNSDYRKSIRKEIMDNGFESLVTLIRKSEDDDPDWKNVRYKHSDDATGVMVFFNK